MAYMRYTGQWWEIFQEFTLDECDEEIKRFFFSPEKSLNIPNIGVSAYR